jgi:hypothetical protein
LTGKNAIALLSWKLLSEINGFARRVVSLVSISQLGIGFTQLGIGQSELRVLLGCCIKFSYRIKVPAVSASSSPSLWERIASVILWRLEGLPSAPSPGNRT